ncbi:MAG: ABC transporter permease [Planctomycetaceae bacterium]|nr:ABC transporter permease [Planctomycetaceae bacterium]
MAVAALPRPTFVHAVGATVIDGVRLVGDLTLFSLQMVRWLNWPRGGVIWPIMYQTGVASIPVILITGGFIGMVLAVQAYDQFAMMNMENQLGTMINITLVKELGPVLAALMLAGRVGCAMAAELGTMRVTEQIDALTALGANPVRFLVVPRFLACFLLIPMLTLVADAVGMLSGWLFSTRVLGVHSYYYWFHSINFLSAYDVLSGVIKSVFFGAAIALIACHRGFHSRAGAEGVGRAATESFVYAFVAILLFDFLLGTFFMKLYYVIWPGEVPIA